MSKCQVPSATIDKLHDNPQTYDRFIFDGNEGATYDRTIIRDGDTICYLGEYVGQTIEEFRKQIIANLDSLRVVALEPRDRCELDPSIIDELYDKPQTGDRICFGIIKGGNLQYERTIVRKGDTIEHEENDLKYTIGEFRNNLIDKYDCIRWVVLAPRGKKR